MGTGQGAALVVVAMEVGWRVVEAREAGTRGAGAVPAEGPQGWPGGPQVTGTPAAALRAEAAVAVRVAAAAAGASLGGRAAAVGGPTGVSTSRSIACT